MTDKELYEYMWKEYNRTDDLDYLKKYVKNTIDEFNSEKVKYSGINPYYKQIALRKPYLEIILEGLEQL